MARFDPLGLGDKFSRSWVTRARFKYRDDGKSSVGLLRRRNLGSAAILEILGHTLETVRRDIHQRFLSSIR